MQMQTVFRLGLAATVASTPFHAGAAVTTYTWDVVETDFTIHVNPKDYIIDTQGVYGQVGRKLLLSDLVGSLDRGTVPNRLETRIEHDPFSTGEDYYVQSHSLDVAYRFDFTVYDYETRQAIASESDKINLQVLSGSTVYRGTPQPQASFGASLIGRAQEPSGILNSFTVAVPYDNVDLDFVLYASGDFPDAHRLTFGPGESDPWGSPAGPGVPIEGLNLELGQGLERYVPPPEERPMRYFYSFTGSVAVTPAIPEPETYALMALGLAGVALSRRLKQRRTA